MVIYKNIIDIYLKYYISVHKIHLIKNNDTKEIYHILTKLLIIVIVSGNTQYLKKIKS